MLAVGLQLFWAWWDNKQGNQNETQVVSQVWTGYSFVLGFLIVFRVQLAYDRFWDACIDSHELRATWFSAVSSLFAFTTDDPAKSADVDYFQKVIVRLMSMIHQAACERLDADEQAEYVLFDNEGCDQKALEFLKQSADRVEVIEQWIEKLIVQNMRNGVLPIPPPIISRCFQDLSEGICLLGDLEVVADFPLPFPLAQMTVLMMLYHFLVTPIIASLIMYNWRWAGLLAFTSSFCCWSLNYIALEIERPFSKTLNGVPGPDLQNEMNRNLTLLMRREMQTLPEYEPPKHGEPIHYSKRKEEECEAVLRNRMTKMMTTGARHSALAYNNAGPTDA